MDSPKLLWFSLLLLTSAVSATTPSSCPAPEPLPHPSALATLNSTTSRRAFIRALTRDAWSAYASTAWGQTILQQVNGTFDPAVRTFDSSGRTIFAALPTLWLQGHRQEYERARSWIDTVFSDFRPEYTEPYLEPLASAYALTGDDFYRRKAKQIGHDLATSKLPNALEVLQISPEINYLLMLIDHPTYVNGERWRKWMNGSFTGRIPKVDGKNTTKTELVDETVRLLIAYAKIHHQAPTKVPDALPALLELLSTAESQYLLEYLPNPGWTFLNRTNHLMRYSDCGLGAALGLAGASLRRHNESDPQAAKLFKLARGIADVCRAMTVATRKRLPKMTFFIKTNATNGGQPYYVLPVIYSEPYQLDPELLETYLVLHRLTGEQKYRDWAWEFAISLYEHSRTGEGAIVGEANQNGTAYQDENLFSGTLNYLYLIFSESWVLPLEKWVFNAAGHALPVYGKNAAWSQEWQ